MEMYRSQTKTKPCNITNHAKTVGDRIHQLKCATNYPTEKEPQGPTRRQTWISVAGWARDTRGFVVSEYQIEIKMKCKLSIFLGKNVNYLSN
jgi:hypothetical protein